MSEQAPGASSAGEDSVYDLTHVLNIGPTCVFVIPKEIDLLLASGGSRVAPIEKEYRNHGAQFKFVRGETKYINLGSVWTPILKSHSDFGWGCSSSVGRVVAIALKAPSLEFRLQLSRYQWSRVCVSSPSVEVWLSNK